LVIITIIIFQFGLGVPVIFNLRLYRQFQYLKKKTHSLNQINTEF